jgi:hypothetical protein
MMFMNINIYIYIALPKTDLVVKAYLSIY